MDVPPEGVGRPPQRNRGRLGAATRRAALALGTGVIASWLGRAPSLGGEAGLAVSLGGSPAPVSVTDPEPPPGLQLPPPRAAMPVQAEDRAEWEAFRQRFVLADGRVVDTGNAGVSHSEGQGWGMLFAVAFDDQDSFDSLLGWTSRTLCRPGDALHAWRYLPRAEHKVPDPNNATDADLFIAAALWRAARRWGRPDHALAARAIARDVLGLLVREAGPRLVLLPGVNGFANGGQLTVNPSYYAFPMLDEMADMLPSPLWARLKADGLALLHDGRFGQWRLPPDWLRVDRATGALAPHPNWPARFSYDAIRVPLYLAWGGQGPTPLSEAFTAYWSTRPGAPPAWVDLTSNATAGYPAPPGMVAVARIATNTAQSDRKLRLPAGFPAVRASPDYYSAALILLSRLAWMESRMV